MTLALPAAMLSWASVLAALIALGAVQHSAWLRAHYSLFLPRPWLFALGAAAFAWAIVRAGSRRPGRLWPRLWALALAMLASLIALAAVVRPGWLAPPQLHALITASLAAVPALAPRLLRIHPDSDWTARVAPLALLLSLGLILPPALIGAQGRVADHPERPGTADGKGVAARIATLRETDAAFRAATDFDWTDFDRRLPQAEAVIGRLRALPPEPLATSAGSTAAPPDAAVSAAAQGLMRTLALGLDPGRAGGIPRLSSLGLGAQGLAGPSRVTAGYFAQIGQRFAALDPAGNGVTAGPLADAYAAIADDLRGYLRVIADRWSDAWAVDLVPEQLRTGLAATLTPRGLLGKTLFAGQDTGYRATSSLLDFRTMQRPTERGTRDSTKL